MQFPLFVNRPIPSTDMKCLDCTTASFDRTSISVRLVITHSNSSNDHPGNFLSCVQTDLCRITMSGKVSDLPIRSKRALFTQKKLDRINFRSGKRGRVLRHPPGITTGQWVRVSRVVGHAHGHMILCHMVLTRWQIQ